MKAAVFRPALFCCLALPFVLAACAGTGPPGPQAPSSRITVTPAPTTWKAVPAKADGAVVAGGRRHMVKRGETGIAIARAYGVSWSRIAAANEIARDSVLQIGQPLFIPTQAAASRRGIQGNAGRPSAEARAKQFSVEVDDLITGSAEAAPSPVPSDAQSAGSQIPPMGWPVDGRVILSGFGPKAGGRVNDGINIRAQRGATVRAAADGQVIYVGDAISGFGLMLLVRHGKAGPNAVVTAYGHLEEALVQRGQQVRRGEPIARAGSSGSVREPQLLFQIRQGRRAIDPRPLLQG